MREHSEGAHRSLVSLVNYRTFETYAKALVNSGDAAPEVRLLCQLAKRESIELVWALLVYSVFGNAPMTITVCRFIAEAKDFSPQLLRAALAHYFGVLRNNLELGSTGDSSTAKLQTLARSCQADPQSMGRDEMLALYSARPCHNRAAAIRIVELLARGLGRADLESAQLGLAGSDVNAQNGAAAGCRALYSATLGKRFEPICGEQFDALGRTIARRLGMGMGDVAVALTKYARLVRGQYFIGHDIHALAKQVRDLFSERAFKTHMAAAGFPRPLYTQRLDVTRCRAAYAREGLLLNRHLSKIQPRLV